VFSFDKDLIFDKFMNDGQIENKKNKEVYEKNLNST